MHDENSNKTTHFGFKEIPMADKAKKVGQVFQRVANKYDVMNDLMSFGIHRLWKRFAIDLAAIRPGQKVLDLAAGTGDLARQLAPIVGENGLVVLADINDAMLVIGRERLEDAGIFENVDYVITDAEQLAFPENTFDCITISFGLRNVTDQQAALNSMYQVLSPGGQLMILEFSKPQSNVLQKIYDVYSFSVLPFLGKLVAKDSASYQYLAESIRKQPNQEALKTMLFQAGFVNCDYHNLSGGIVAIHRGFKA